MSANLFRNEFCRDPEGESETTFRGDWFTVIEGEELFCLVRGGAGSFAGVATTFSTGFDRLLLGTGGGPIDVDVEEEVDDFKRFFALAFAS